MLHLYSVPCHNQMRKSLTFQTNIVLLEQSETFLNQHCGRLKLQFERKISAPFFCLRQWLVVALHQQALEHQKFNNKAGTIVERHQSNCSIRIGRDNRAIHQNQEMSTVLMQMNHQNRYIGE